MTGKACKLALDIGGTSAKGGLVVGGACIDIFELPVRSAANAAGIMEDLMAVGEKGARLAAAHGLRIDGVGVSVPGPFDYRTGASLMTHKLAAVRGISLTGWLLRHVGDVPVRYMSDSTAFLLGAAAELGIDSALAVIIGTGLGCAAMVDGQLLQTQAGGPAIVLYNRPFRDGTAEDYVSKRAIMARYRHAAGAELEVRELAELARRGDGTARRVFERSGEDLAEILLPVLCEHSFDYVVLGSQIAKSRALLTDPLQRRLQELGCHCKVVVPKELDQAPLLGAVSGME